MMSLDFQCPSCKHVLQFSNGDSFFQNCRHCKGKIIVPSSVVHLMEIEMENASGPSLSRQRNIEAQTKDRVEYFPTMPETPVLEQIARLREPPVAETPSRQLSKPNDAPRPQLIKLIFYIMIAIALYYWFSS